MPWQNLQKRWPLSSRSSMSLEHFSQRSCTQLTFVTHRISSLPAGHVQQHRSLCWLLYTKMRLMVTGHSSHLHLGLGHQHWQIWRCYAWQLGEPLFFLLLSQNLDLIERGYKHGNQWIKKALKSHSFLELTFCCTLWGHACSSDIRELHFKLRGLLNLNY